MMVQQSQTPNHGKKYENNGKGGYFRLDDDNKMGYIIYFQSPNGTVQRMQPHILQKS